MFGRKLYKTKLCLLFQRGRCPRQSCNFAHGEAELRRFGGSFSGRRDFRSADLRDKLDRSDRRHRKKQRTDGGSDQSESFKASDDSEVRKKGGKDPSYNEKDDLEEQLKQLQLDIEMLDDHKYQLEGLLDEKINETHNLSTRIEDLESQLHKEQDDCKRSQTRLQKIGDQLFSDTLKLNAYEDDPSVNIISDGEHNVNGNSRKREMTFRSEKLQRSEGPAPLPETTIKKIEMMKAIQKRNKSSVEDYNHKHGRNASSILYLDKGKGSEVRHTLPLTGMAAHAVDELLEANEFDEKSEAAETTAINESDDAKHSTKTTHIPPPPTDQNAYKQYEGDDEEVDVEKVDSEMLDIDINSELDI
ncbi:hypothetical protein ZIOFF_017132 [Zingiber officinale]|uniref:C3H1-type domain-containing protein n=1 Tax=Zingiber officinale TaxID=94328 RepID=A0A8J5H4D8_ZINOF|nr:hypothetical protein ZIOFF_017132 [Zingiber officinale]